MAALAYISEGSFQYGDIMDMSSVDRVWYLRKLTDYKKREADAMRKASKGKG